MNGFTYITLFAGLDAVSIAVRLLALPWILAAYSEIDDLANSILKARFPGVPNLGNVLHAQGFPVDLVWLSPPCQDWSGLNDRALAAGGSRSWLLIDGLKLALRSGAKIIIIENVAILGKRSDYRRFLDKARDICHREGYATAWRVVCPTQLGCGAERKRIYIVAVRCDEPGFPQRILCDPLPQASFDWSAVLEPSMPANIESREAKTWALERSNDSLLPLFVSRREAHKLLEGKRKNLSPEVLWAFESAGERVPRIVDPNPWRAQAPIFWKGFRRKLADSRRGCATITRNGMNQIGLLQPTDVGLLPRCLSVREACRLMGIPPEHLALPGFNRSTEFKLIGNSLDIDVVAWILSRAQIELQRLRMAAA